jgi:hypothetical protein
MSLSKVGIIYAVACLLLSLVAVGTSVCLPGFGGIPTADDTAFQDPGVRGQATVYISEPIQDFGHTVIRKKWDVVFQIQNTGTRRLVLNELNPDCACDDRVGRAIVVPPSETASVVLSLDTRFSSGPAEASLSLMTNDPAHPRIKLVAQAWVDAAEASPYSSADDATDSSILIRQ